ncbi:MAG: hypothetical protein MJ207_02590 [Bacilli bacterium]|nr:hypothetical protein [Bacilli bacterium]
MIRSTLHIYRKNVWNIFAVVGIVSLGIIVALIVAAPTIYDLLFYNVTKIIASASAIPQSGFNATAFIDSLTKQLGGLNWGDPFLSITSLLDNQGYVHLFTQALIDSGFQKEVLGNLTTTISECATALVDGIKAQLLTMLVLIGVACLIAFIASRVVIQLRTARIRSPHKDKEFAKNIKRFFIMFGLNLFTVLLAYTLVILCLLYCLYIIASIFIILAILLGLFTCSFLWATLCYRSKNLHFKKVFNLKTYCKYLLCCLITISISLVILVVTFFISDIIAILIALPLIFVSNIIMENIAISYTTNYYKIIRATNKRRRAKLAKAM